ncbi:hypothetical protein BDB00DRAFT_759640, partial [Zychaea mexicana]|uniref:uncharacterized protein n=1 Tax=Zychaea mexicana TaxID=64656 RepID=UPI0022FEE398
DLYWAQISIINILDLFLYDILPANDDIEADLIHQKWGFIQLCFYESKLRVQSSSSSVRKNEAWRTDDEGLLDRKLVGTKVDLIFINGAHEYGCLEVTCSNDQHNTKATIEGRLKLPRTLKDMLASLSKMAPTRTHDLKVIGFIVTGRNLTLYILDCPNSSVVRIKKFGLYEFPSSVEQFSKMFIPLLSLVWQAKTIMKNTLAIINDDDDIVLPTDDGLIPSPIPPCMPSPKASSKRKIYEIDAK